MSSSEGKGELQLSHPGQAFPFFTVTAPPPIRQWCRFSIPDCFPLKPFRQDRFTRLPLPPAVMATSKVVSSTGVGNFQATVVKSPKSGGIDPYMKIQQLEKNLAFVRENHALMLRGLHEEIAELKQKNRELLFELVTGITLMPKENSDDQEGRDSPEEQQDKIEKLEKEIKKLHGALKDARKVNSSLSTQLQEMKRDQYSKHSSRHKIFTKSSSGSAVDHPPCGPSPQMEGYSDTLRQIQRASSHSGKHRERYRYNDDNFEWSDNYIRNNNGYHHGHHHHHSQHQKSPQLHHQQQPRLPRLPLRSQQNFSHPQYEIQCRQSSSSVLPVLVPVLDQRLDKPRKHRNPRTPKLADQAING